LTAEALANAEYFDENQKRSVKLSKGVFDDGLTHIQIDGQPVFGDVNGDGIPEGVVVLQSSYGGTGVFPLLIIMVDQNGKPFQFASKPLGDRIRIEKVSVEDGDIVLNMIVHQAHEGLCCPSQKAVWIFRLCGNQLIRIYASAEDQ
jgi:hypothetical protein